MQDNKEKIILFDIYTTGHHGYYALALSKYLYEKGYEVIFITFRDERTEVYFKDNPCLKVEYLGGNPHKQIKSNFLMRNIQIFRYLNKCFNLANSYRAKILHILYLDHNIIPLFLALKVNNPKFNVLGTLFWPYFINNKNANLFHKYYYKLTAFLMKNLLLKKKLSCLFVHTSNIKNLIEKELKLEDFNNGKIVTIPDPSLMFHEYCSTKEARKRLNLPQDEPILLYFGVLTYEKGLDILLDAIKDIKERFKLVIAGRPVYFTKSYIESYKAQIEDASKIVNHIKYIPQEDVPLYFLSADAVILPYRKMFLGTSGVLQQACGAGKPVIVTDVGENGKAVKNYNLGIVVEPESPDALRKAIQCFLRNHKEIIERKKQNILNYAEEHSWIKMSEITELVYRSFFNC